MKVKASKLTFISRIKRDGSGVEPVNNLPEDNQEFKLKRLSISEDTYIAHGFNSYVVKLKNK